MMPSWMPDGAGTRAKIGVLTPHMDPVPESEYQAMAPDGVSVHVARVRLGMMDRMITYTGMRSGLRKVERLLDEFSFGRMDEVLAHHA